MLMCQQIAVLDCCFNSRTWSDAGLKTKSGIGFVPWPFDWLPCASASLLARAGSLMELSVSEPPESLENNESGNEMSVWVDPRLGRRAISNGKLVRELEGYDEEMFSL